MNLIAGTTEMLHDGALPRRKWTSGAAHASEDRSEGEMGRADQPGDRPRRRDSAGAGRRRRFRGQPAAARESARTSGCSAGSPQATTKPPSSHALARPRRDHASGLADDRHQRLHVVGVERRLDHDVDESHREQAIGVAVAAPAGEAGAARRPGRTPSARRRCANILGSVQATTASESLGQRRVFNARRSLPRRHCAPPPAVAMNVSPTYGWCATPTTTSVAVVERDERRPVHLAEDEAAGAVDRVDDPHVLRGAALRAVLLAANAVVGIGARDLRADDRLGGVIGDGDGIVAFRSALVLDVERGAEVREDRVARRLRGAEREFEQGGFRGGVHGEGGVALRSRPSAHHRTAGSPAATRWPLHRRRPVSRVPSPRKGRCATRRNCRAGEATPPYRRSSRRADERRGLARPRARR